MKAEAGSVEIEKTSDCTRDNAEIEVTSEQMKGSAEIEKTSDCTRRRT